MGAKERDEDAAGLEYRSELRSGNLDEDTGVIELEAKSRQPVSSIPVPAKGIAAVLSVKPSWQMVAIVAIAAVAFLAGGSLRPAVDKVIAWVQGK